MSGSRHKIKDFLYPFNKVKVSLSKKRSHQFKLFKHKAKNSVRALSLYRSIYGNETNLAGEKNKNLRDAIRLAMGANAYAKSIFHHRSNVLEDVVESKGLAHLQKKLQYLLREEINKSLPEDQKKRFIMYCYNTEISGYVTQGSTCGEFAAAAYTFAGELNKNKELSVYFCNHNADHGFVIISDNKDIFIVCDPWINFVGNIKTDADYIKKFHHADQAAVSYDLYHDAVNALSHPSEQMSSAEQRFSNDVVKIIPFEKIDFNYDEVEKSIETLIKDEESLLKSFYEKESAAATCMLERPIKIENPDKLHDTVKEYPFCHFSSFYGRSDVELSEKVKFGNKVKIPYEGNSESEEEQDFIRGRGMVVRIKC